jgi:hypothetical protein
MRLFHLIFPNSLLTGSGVFWHTRYITVLGFLHAQLPFCFAFSPSQLLHYKMSCRTTTTTTTTTNTPDCPTTTPCSMKEDHNLIKKI